jgi:hypothetical protein
VQNTLTSKLFFWEQTCKTLPIVNKFVHTGAAVINITTSTFSITKSEFQSLLLDMHISGCHQVSENPLTSAFTQEVRFGPFERFGMGCMLSIRKENYLRSGLTLAGSESGQDLEKTPALVSQSCLRCLTCLCCPL